MREGDVPALQLGTMNFGGRTPEAVAHTIVRRAIELGVSVFDTANAYQNGESERILGRALGSDRPRVKIATKVGFRRVAGKPEGLSRGVVIRALEDSLQRLGTDYVDIYYLHVPDHQTPIAETLEALGTLLGRGLIKHWAISNYSSWQILEMMQIASTYGLPRPLLAQQLYNLLIRQLDLEYTRFAKQYELRTCVYNPLAGGLLAGTHQRESTPKGSRFDNNPFYRRRYWHPISFDHVDALRTIAKAADKSLVELAYAWLAQRAVVDAVIVGPSSLEHLDAAHVGLRHRLAPETLAAIDEVSVRFAGTDSSYAR